MIKTNALTKVAALAAAAFLTPAVMAQQTGSEIFANVDNYLGTYTAFVGNNEIGDEVNFAGTARTLTGFNIEYFLSAGGTAQGEVFLRALDGPTVDGEITPGSVLYQSGVLDLTDGLNNFEATGLSLTVPGTIVYSVVFSGLSGGETAGLTYYNPPTVGTSADDFWQMDSGAWARFDTPGVVDNFGAVFYAVPEPTTWALMLGGMGVLGFLSFRRKS